MAIIDDVSELKVNSQKKVLYYCDDCGMIGEQKYNLLLNLLNKYNKTTCPRCSMKCRDEIIKRKIYDAIVKEAEEKDFKVITSFEERGSDEDDFAIECPIHGRIITKIKTLRQNTWCVKCNKEKRHAKKSEDYYNFATEWSNKHGYILLTDKKDFRTVRSMIRYICPQHGEGLTTIELMKRNHGCLECGKIKRCAKRRKSIGYIKEEFEKYNGVILNPEDYKNTGTKNLKIICPRCGEIFITSRSSFIRSGGQLCPDCSSKESVGEMRIRKFLELNNISFEQEKSFDDLRIVHLLRFDFYIKEYNLMVEHHGEQHYVDRSVTNVFKYSLEDNQHRDNMKRDYCTTNGIDLFEIQFNHYKTIEKRLAKKLISIDPTLVLKFNDGSIMDKEIADKTKFKKDKNIYNTHNDIV